ncbi:winged helix-turn-helix domain-containing tetratricopeptide repeat protein [Phenylobacterium sp.]|uniref:winged helix-turn-helix domain-containing tetratricopeptide repeat protein n=1 Tax=Phenylobacterium sp. TaxID=1871053 RepID=UPI002E34EEC9|nr:winged helix-turn-helix domain-containing protein [Phenylobacterium sp.]HEX4710069.1 winged helix-turn-helix domain-containing protein [Phenylobacterium sp.]
MADLADLKGGSAARSAPIDLAREADLRLGSALVRPSLSEVVAASQTIRLQPRVMQVLVALARADGEVVSRDELLASCWGGLAIGDDAINRCIGRLRRLSEEEAPGAFTIGTLPRIGYRLSQVADRASPPPAQGAVRKLSICVLPFANLSDDPQQKYFSDGISEDIITDLSKVSALSVVARNTAFTFKGKVRDVARELGVSHVLEGSVRKAGDRVRITVQLIDGAAGDHIWAERYDRDLTDIFALQDEISMAIVTALKLKLLPQEMQAIAHRGTESVEAYDLYLVARSYYLTGNYGDPRRDEAIERLCRRAVEIDPVYAQAWALLATGQYSLHSNHGRAGDGGRAALDRALTLNPDLAEARALKALKLSEMGRHEEAAAEIAVALRLDPESYEVNWRAGSSSYNQGRLAEAVPYFEKATALATDTGAPMMLISCYVALGDAENARRIAWVVLERAEQAVARDRSNGNALGAGVAALAALDEADRAKDWMRRALLIDPDNLLMRYNFSRTLARSMGDDPEAVLAMLGQALERDTGRLVTAASADPDFAGLRGDPRFQAMLSAAKARLAAAKPADGAGAPESA